MNKRRRRTQKRRAKLRKLLALPLYANLRQVEAAARRLGECGAGAALVAQWARDHYAPDARKILMSSLYGKVGRAGL